MELPLALRSAVEEIIEGLPRARLMSAARDTSERYRENSGGGSRLLTTDVEAAAYAASRMPATYGAVRTAFKHTLARLGDMGDVTLIDVGAGTGAGTWAANDALNIARATCLEREHAMREIGGALMKNAGGALANADWREFDLTSDAPVEHADVVLISYVLNELTETHRLRAAEKLFDAADRLLLIVEPGTPSAWRQLMRLRREMVARGAHIAAPCPHADECPVTGDDWCHFTCRVARSRLHKALKAGEAPYEDEKFTYLALTKTAVEPARGRVTRHPQIEPGRIMLKVCAQDGLGEMTVRKKDGALFKWARKCACGDELPGKGDR